MSVRARLLDDLVSLPALCGRPAAKYPLAGGVPRVLSAGNLEAAFGRHAARNIAVVVEPERVASWDHTRAGSAY